MSAKSDVLEQLGDTALILPELINRALAANDRVKYYLTLLQSARDHAAHANAAPLSLRVEREASGVDDASLDAVVAGSTREDEHRLRIPHAGMIHERIVDGIRQMLEPFNSALGVTGGAPPDRIVGANGSSASSPRFRRQRVIA
jgi:hypothetical protein